MICPNSHFWLVVEQGEDCISYHSHHHVIPAVDHTVSKKKKKKKVVVEEELKDKKEGKKEKGRKSPHSVNHIQMRNI